jgi:hypothetical protein
MPADERFCFNGIDATSGRPLLAELPAAALARLARGLPLDAEAIELQQQRADQPFLTAEDVDPTLVEQAGWGVVFAHGADPAIREALAPLLAHRKAQAGTVDERRYREFTGPDAHRPGERKQAFLARHGVARSGPVDPDRLPYYLLIVGDPDRVPFEFQAQLDVQYAVGRLHFDHIDDYAHYARNVVLAESTAPTRAGLTMFAPRPPGDRASELACDHLIAGLHAAITKTRRNCPLSLVPPEAADKARLTRLLGGPDTPALLFTASHGLGFPADDPRQRDHQGALLCQDWPGPAWSRPIPPEFYFAGHDLAHDADLRGLVAFCFACFGGGTPRTDAFHPHGAGPAPLLAAKPFIARLAQRLLAHPSGALAVVAHVDRSWASSFHGGRSGPQVEVFTSALKRMIDGHPVGYAMEYFGSRYAELSADLALALDDDIEPGLARERELADLWTTSSDARNFVVLGDPAVRARIAP